jgi:hypothetical protein
MRYSDQKQNSVKKIGIEGEANNLIMFNVHASYHKSHPSKE